MRVGDTYHACQYGDQRSVIIIALLDIDAVAHVIYRRLSRGAPTGNPEIDTTAAFTEEYNTTYAAAKRKYLRGQIAQQEHTSKHSRTILEKLRRDLSNVRDDV